MSLLSLPTEILLKCIFSCESITISDLLQLMLSCRELHIIIAESNQLWMCKFSTRWPEMYNKLKEKDNIFWKNWVFSLRIIEEVKKAATSLSSQCYPLGKRVNPILVFEKWFGSEGYPTFLFAEDELSDLVFNEEMRRDLTLSHYGSVPLQKLRTCLQVRNLNSFMAKSESQKTLLEGAKLISKWFSFKSIIDYNPQKDKLLDNVEQSLLEIVERVKQLVEERNSTALVDILKCINKVFFGEMRFRDYNEDGFFDYNHEAASIHWVLKKRIGYSAVVCVIYFEVATRMGITCEPFSIPCAHCSEKLYVKCRVDGNPDVFYLNICYDSSSDLSPIIPSLIGKLARSFEVMFRQMLEGMVFRDERSLSRSDLRAFASIRLVCALWPTTANVMKYAKLCLEFDDQVEDAYQLLLLAEIDSNDPVMIDCVQRLRSQQAVMDSVKVVRRRLPSIVYAIGLVMTFSIGFVFEGLRDMDCVIVSWDECYREQEARQKWGLNFTPVTDGYRLDQPFYHVICFTTLTYAKKFTFLKKLCG